MAAPVDAAVAAPILPAAGNLGDPSLGDGSWSSNPSILYPAETPEEAMWSPVPIGAETLDTTPLPFTTDWSATVRGDAIHSTTGDQFQTVFSPQASLSHAGSFLSYTLGASGQFSKTDGQAVKADQLQLSGQSTLNLSETANLLSNASVTLSQEDVTNPDVPGDVATTPQKLSGSADTTYTQQFGRFSVALRGTAARTEYGSTTLTDGTVVGNADLNSTTIGGGARLGYAVTPVVQLFTDGGVAHTRFDAPSTAIGGALDGNLYTIKAGATAKWGETLTASASIGEGLERFDDSAFADVRATLYDADLGFEPTTTLTLAGNFSSAINSPGPNGSGTAQIAYTATGSATYKVNDWLDWRGSLNWHDTAYATSSATDTGYGYGVGADYLLSPHTILSADYTFAHQTVTPNPAVDTQTISVGVTYKK